MSVQGSAFTGTAELSRRPLSRAQASVAVQHASTDAGVVRRVNRLALHNSIRRRVATLMKEAVAEEPQGLILVKARRSRLQFLPD